MILWEITLKNGVQYWIGAADEEDAMIHLIASDATTDVVSEIMHGFSITEHEDIPDCIYHGDTGHPELMRTAWEMRGSKPGVFACSEWIS